MPRSAIDASASSTRAVAAIVPVVMAPTLKTCMSRPVNVPEAIDVCDNRPISVCDARLPVTSGPPDFIDISNVSPATVDGLSKPARTLPTDAFPPAWMLTLAPVWIGPVARIEPLENTARSRPATTFATVMLPIPGVLLAPKVLSSKT